MIVNEILGGDGQFFFNQLQKLAKAGILWFQDSDGKQHKVKNIEKVSDGVNDGEVYYAHFTVVAQNDDNTLRSRLVKMSLLDEFYRVKRQEIDGEKRMVFQRNQLGESVDHSMPMMVSMLRKLVSNHFKKQGPMVKLDDDEYNIQRKLISGAGWQANALVVHINTENGIREIMYPQYLLKDVSLKHDKEEDEWVLKYDPK